MPKLLLISNWLPEYRIPLYERIIDEFGKENVCYLWLHESDPDNISRKSKKIFENSHFSKKYLKTPFGPKISIGFTKKVLKLKPTHVITLPTTYLETWYIWFIVKKLLDAKLILWDEEFEWIKSFKRRLIMPITSYINKNSDFILVPSNKHALWQINQGVCEADVFLFPNVTNIGKDTKNVNEIQDIKEKYSLKDEKIITYVGQLIPRKGITYLIDAYYDLLVENPKYVSETCLMIVGDGISKIELFKKTEKILKVGGRVIFTGQIENSELVKYYSLSYFGVVPSVNINGEAEPHALVVNEFMALDKPVITTNMVGATYSLCTGSLKDFRVREKSSKDIKKQLTKILNMDPFSYQNLQKSINHEFIQYNNYSINIKVLNKIINKNTK
ncbi:glycosyltransferase family 4 protein [Methanococcus maripaludis]|uniref:Glycosyltransferase involved in cell wall biosynthesis n=1 Tax=Methanococcus maripaludis TaxID=39152 RepID=A0A7J9RXU0_METMI|nr:glycosyltransferase family 4 protein [Methanococcus maripaludis]MBB6066839.1 glycosyltransferase involved in cell wall biosynthesis [Methanococcus maripaludis]